ncbi:MAG: autotransporter assembly complex family protein [Pseudomonadota bacterium]
MPRVDGLLLLVLLLSMSLVPFHVSAEAVPAVGYTAEIAGAPGKKVRDLMESVSKTVNMQDKPPATLNLLRRRAEEDIPTLLQVLRSQGYYGGEIDVEVNERTRPVPVIFHVRPGPAYVLEAVQIERVGTQPVELLSAGEVGLQTGKPADAREIIDAEETLARQLRREGFPSPRIERQVVVDHTTKKVRVAYRVDPGQLAYFGQTVITGLETISEKFVTGKIPWQRGDTFDASLLVELRNRLIRTGLFSLVQVTEGKSIEDSLLPVGVEVQERKRRTVAAGLSYYTDEGLGARLSWENRNLFGEAERLRINGIASSITLSTELIYEEPAFLREDQSLLFSTRMAEDRTDAFTSRNLEAALVLERVLSNLTRFGAGPALRWSRVYSLEGTSTFGLLSFPSHLNRDTSDSLLNPTRGGRFSLQFTPYTNIFGTDVSFFKAHGSYSHYLRLLDSPLLLVAGRAGLGAITGVDRDSVPADIRFYAGGGGSIRGYAFQTVGPLLNGEPTGGRSLVEAGVEFRLKVTDTIGFVAFLDGGNVYDTVHPQLDEGLRWGAGVGVRYYTTVGPIRFDVAVPLDPRDDIDDPCQLYVSLGQAF